MSSAEGFYLWFGFITGHLLGFGWGYVIFRSASAKAS